MSQESSKIAARPGFDLMQIATTARGRAIVPDGPTVRVFDGRTTLTFELALDWKMAAVGPRLLAASDARRILVVDGDQRRIVDTLGRITGIAIDPQDHIWVGVSRRDRSIISVIRPDADAMEFRFEVPAHEAEGHYFYFEGSGNAVVSALCGQDGAGLAYFDWKSPSARPTTVAWNEPVSVVGMRETSALLQGDGRLLEVSLPSFRETWSAQVRDNPWDTDLVESGAAAYVDERPFAALHSEQEDGDYGLGLIEGGRWRNWRRMGSGGLIRYVHQLTPDALLMLIYSSGGASVVIASPAD